MNKKPVAVFKAALDAPWAEWPDQIIHEEKLQSLCSILSKSATSFATSINSVTSNIHSRKHNVVVVAKLPDGFPFFVRHLPPLAYASNSFLFVLSNDAFSCLLDRSGIKSKCRCLSTNIDESLLTAFSRPSLDMDYPKDIKVKIKPISRKKNKNNV